MVMELLHSHFSRFWSGVSAIAIGREKGNEQWIYVLHSYTKAMYSIGPNSKSNNSEV